MLYVFTETKILQQCRNIVSSVRKINYFVRSFKSCIWKHKAVRKNRKATKCKSIVPIILPLNVELLQYEHNRKTTKNLLNYRSTLELIGNLQSTKNGLWIKIKENTRCESGNHLIVLSESKSRFDRTTACANSTSGKLQPIHSNWFEKWIVESDGKLQTVVQLRHTFRENSGKWNKKLLFGRLVTEVFTLPPVTRICKSTRRNRGSLRAIQNENNANWVSQKQREGHGRCAHDRENPTQLSPFSRANKTRVTHNRLSP